VSTDDEIPSVLKDLADASTKSAEVQNRYWLALAVASLFVVIPPSDDAQGVATTKMLPFGLGSVDSPWFAVLSVLLLSVLVIAFCAAQAHLIRTQELVARILTQRREKGAKLAGNDERDILDALRMPSLSRVSSLAQAIRGRHQFFADKSQISATMLRVTTALHVFWKLLVLVVWLLFPAVALGFAVVLYRRTSVPELLPSVWPALVWPLVSGAAIAWCVTAFTETRYLLRSAIRMSSKEG
jgi:hypothetical protein